MIKWWYEQYTNFMPHIHCLNYDMFIVSNTIANDSFTLLQYLVISACFFYAGSWGDKRKDWRKICNALAFVFIFCGSNYLMNVVVIYYPFYYLQLLLKIVGNIFFLKALYHIITIDRTSLVLLFNAVKRTIKQEGF